VNCGRSPFPFPRRIAKTPRQRVNHEIPAERYSGTLSRRRRVRMSLLPKRSRATPRKCRKFGRNLTALRYYSHCGTNNLVAGWGARIRTWEWRNQKPANCPFITTPFRRWRLVRGGRPADGVAVFDALHRRRKPGDTILYAFRLTGTRPRGLPGRGCSPH
jgi:hypothetical protein